MLNRIPRNIPPLSTLLAELGATPKEVARVLQVSERTVYSWLRTGREPWSARIALFWLTHWGYSIINTDAENAARLYAGLARARADQIHELETSARFSVIKKAARAANDAGFSRIDPSDSNTQCQKYYMVWRSLYRLLKRMLTSINQSLLSSIYGRTC